MGPGWVRWTVTLWESANRSELGASDRVNPLKLQFNPGMAKWTVFWSLKKLDVAGRGELDGVLHVNPDRW